MLSPLPDKTSTYATTVGHSDLYSPEEAVISTYAEASRPHAVNMAPSQYGRSPLHPERRQEAVAAYQKVHNFSLLQAQHDEVNRCVQAGDRQGALAACEELCNHINALGDEYNFHADMLAQYNKTKHKREADELRELTVNKFQKLLSIQKLALPIFAQADDKQGILTTCKSLRDMHRCIGEEQEASKYDRTISSMFKRLLILQQEVIRHSELNGDQQKVLEAYTKCRDLHQWNGDELRVSQYNQIIAGIQQQAE